VTDCGREPWSDDRLASAYRAAFEVTAPSGLDDRVVTAVASNARPSRPVRGWLRWSGTSASAVAAVAVVVIAAGFLVSNGLPTGSPASSHAATGSPETDSPEKPTAGFPTTIFGVEVLTVPRAIEVRDRGDATELAVAGWYQQAGPVICPVEPTQQTQLLEGCSLVTQWLMADPETLVPLPDAFLGGPAPAGPAIQPVFDGVEAGWGYPSSIQDATPRPVVIVGHFHDVRAVDCRDENRQACRERFVVDQIPWVDGAAHDAVFPADVDGIPVWTVEETIGQRDAGSLHGIAVAIGAWYAETIPLGPSCLPPQEPWGPLEQYCDAGLEYLSDIPTDLDTASQPLGTTIEPWIPTYWGDAPPVTDQKWHPAVFVGHFDDPLATDCPHLGVDVCRSSFAVDRIAWLDGKPYGVRLLYPHPFFFPPTPARNPLDVARFVRQLLVPDGAIQSITQVEARDIADLDPTADLAIDEGAWVWYVRAVEAGTNRIGSFIVDDATGELLWSAFPMPAIEVP
jgi:hypothetical protein